jgi:hypothetical protein
VKLVRARIQNFRSIEDTGEFQIDDLTCLVGKNEAGKTAILEALYGQRAYREFEYDQTRDYPRRFLTKFKERHPNGQAEVARTWWQLSTEDIQAVNDALGAGVLATAEIQVASGIGIEGTHWVINVDEHKCIDFAIDQLRLNAAEKAQVTGITSTSALLAKLKTISDPSPKLAELRDQLAGYRGGRATLKAIDILSERMPKFFLTSHFNRMSGEISLNELQ